MTYEDDGGDHCATREEADAAFSSIVRAAVRLAVWLNPTGLGPDIESAYDDLAARLSEAGVGRLRVGPDESGHYEPPRVGNPLRPTGLPGELD